MSKQRIVPILPAKRRVRIEVRPVKRIAPPGHTGRLCHIHYEVNAPDRLIARCRCGWQSVVRHCPRMSWGGRDCSALAGDIAAHYALD